MDAGLDATINTGTIDFTWKNNTNSDIFIVASAEGKKVHIEIYGEAWPEEYDEIRLTSDYIGSIAPKAMKITQDSTKPTGYEQIVRKEKSGSKYASYKHYYKDGKLVKGAVQPTPTQPVTPTPTPTPQPTPTPTAPPQESTPAETDAPPTDGAGDTI